MLQCITNKMKRDFPNELHMHFSPLIRPSRKTATLQDTIEWINKNNHCCPVSLRDVAMPAASRRPELLKAAITFPIFLSPACMIQFCFLIRKVQVRTAPV